MGKLHLSHSQLSVARECPRKYEHIYIRKRVPRAEREALSFGRLWHEIMERWWRDGQEVAVQWMATTGHKLFPGQQPEEAASKMAAMLRYYSPPIERWDVVGVERPLTVPVVNPGTGIAMRVADITMRLDVLVTERSTGELWLVEHKTTSEDIVGFGPYWQRLAIDAQIGIYLLATGAAGVVYDVVRKPRIKLCGKDETVAARFDILPSEAYQQRCEDEIAADLAGYYQLREIRKTPADLEEARWDLYQWAVRLHEQRKHGHYPRNANACRGLYGNCEYLEVCTGQALLEDDALFKDREWR
jgi:hypothetical protein